MTQTVSQLPDATRVAPVEHLNARGWLRTLPPVAMLVTVFVGCLLPLIRNPNFYYWDDTAAAFMPMWQRIGGDILSGQSPFFQIDMWRGGNVLGEANTGLWNPVTLLLMIVTHPLDDVATAITIGKFVLFLVAAGGVFLLARNYGASPWMAAAAGAVFPLSGWVLYMNGTSWINELAINAFVPWAWWAIRRAMQRGGRGWSIPLAAFCGYLTFSVGDPYGLLALAVVFLAVGVEVVIAHRWRELWWLVLLGIGLVLLAVIIFLPFVLTSPVGFRADSGIWNNEMLSPNLSDLLGMSVTSFKPYMTAFGLPYLTFPGIYLAWFALPVLPWLRWRITGGWRSLTGVLAFGIVFLLLVLGPSQLGMFRWPGRLIPFLYLAVIICLVVVLSDGVRRNKPALRWSLSAVIILGGAWLAFSDMPQLWKWHALTTVLVAAFLWVFLKWGDVRVRGYAILAVASIIMLGAQVAIAPGNGNVADYNFPRSRSAMTEQFSKYHGLTVQIADFMAMGRNLAPDKAWTSMLGGSLYSVAGVESTTAYSGVGYTKLDDALCITYNGGTCPRAWDQLWAKQDDGHSLADLMKAQTVVVERHFTNDVRPPRGWSVQSRNQWVTVYHRDGPLPYPNGRVSAASGVTVTSDKATGSSVESIGVDNSRSGTLTFARLDWPGYSASLAGKPLTVRPGPGGLLVVDVPSGASGTVALRFTPPGLQAGMVSAALGIVLIAVVSVLRARRRTRGKVRAGGAAATR